MTPEGWETDPAGRGRWRWWDGARWGDKVSCPGIAVADPLPEGDWPAPEPAKRSTLKERLTDEIRRQLPGRKTAVDVVGERFRTRAYLVVAGSLTVCIVIAGDDDVLMRQPTSKGTQPLLAFPRSDVKGIEVEEWSAARHEYGWKLSTGFMHSGKHVQATSGVTIDLGGETLLLQVSGLAPIVRSQFELLLDA